ncbi:MarR family transcriptional regulator [Curtobacterium sp. MCBD17_035]|uniref:MarR family winged helix-turn-helix transcriptional regulator n=1 Tax=Curtobacterium sp. MCBD17_035 TaxID=2175673 RepID=UPI000DA9C35D|nr:MarR family transcriptional regulator [Curtobacterium sp. MCBD17_035]WIB66614.1 MarR family transcriptional regulator [Curtobacterium sp. MCBD17_035]
MTETPIDRGDVAARLAVAVGRINRRARPGTGALSYGLVSALSTIVRLAPLRPGDLARHEVVTKPTMTRVLSDLDARGLIERVTDPLDGRASVITATPAGVAAVHEARHERAGIVSQLLADLDDGDLRAIAGALDALERVAQVEPLPAPSGRSAAPTGSVHSAPSAHAASGGAASGGAGGGTASGRAGGGTLSDTVSGEALAAVPAATSRA